MASGNQEARTEGCRDKKRTEVSFIIHLGRLPDRTLSPNSRQQWSKSYKSKKEFKEEVFWLCHEQGIPPQPIDPAHITITWVSKDKRKRDIDNLFASMKSAIDGLVESRVIEDDSADHVTYTLRYEQGGEADTMIQVDPPGEVSDGSVCGS